MDTIAPRDGSSSTRASPRGEGPAFPRAFMKGIGISVWQNSSDGAPATADGRGVPSPPTGSNWYTYATRKNFFGQKDLSSAWERSNDFWNLFETHIRLARDSFGTNSFRFSFEWSRLEPTGPGQVDTTAVERYHTIIDSMIAHGLEPMCTLHHFTHPQWFEDLGGFTKEENIPHFLAYCKRVFGWFGTKIRLWATFNEPTCFAFVGFIAGLWCPGKTMQFKQAGHVLCNLLVAHVQVYQALKAMPGGRQACIGLVHQHIRFMPKSKYTPHIKLLCKWMTYWFASDVMLKFFRTGVFEWKVPLMGLAIRRAVPEAPKTLDWWGINYYSYPCISGMFNLGASKAKEPVSDNSFRVYPQGLYDSVKDASVLHVPIFITETGSADREGRHRRQIIEGHCSMVVKSIHDGYDVRGIYYWTLMDNIEWHEGFHMKFGLFEWDPTSTDSLQSMKLRSGSEALREAYRTWPDSVADMRTFALDKHGWLATQQLARGTPSGLTTRPSGASISANGSRSTQPSPHTSARVKNAWSEGVDLSARGRPPGSQQACGDEEEEIEDVEPVRVESSPNLELMDGLPLAHALTASSVRLGITSNNTSNNGAVTSRPGSVRAGVSGSQGSLAGKGGSVFGRLGNGSSSSNTNSPTGLGSGSMAALPPPPGTAPSSGESSPQAQRVVVSDVTEAEASEGQGEGGWGPVLASPNPGIITRVSAASATAGGAGSSSSPSRRSSLAPQDTGGHHSNGRDKPLGERSSFVNPTFHA